MAVSVNMTEDELKNNYEFKITKKVLLREFPWIKDVQVRGDINQYNLIFLDIYLNPYDLQKLYGWPFMWYGPKVLREGQYFSPHISTIFDIPYEEGRPVVDAIEKTIDAIHNSPAIPRDLKLPGTRSFSVGSYYMNGDIPEGHQVLASPRR